MKIRTVVVEDAGEREIGRWRRRHRHGRHVAQQQPQRKHARAPGIFAFPAIVCIFLVVWRGRRGLVSRRRRCHGMACSVDAGQRGMSSRAAKETV